MFRAGRGLSCQTAWRAARECRPMSKRAAASVQPKRSRKRRCPAAWASQATPSSSQSMTAVIPSPWTAAASLGNSGLATQRAMAAASSHGRSRSDEFFAGSLESLTLRARLTPFRWAPCPRLRGHVAAFSAIHMPTQAWAWHPHSSPLHFAFCNFHFEILPFRRPAVSSTATNTSVHATDKRTTPAPKRSTWSKSNPPRPQTAVAK